MGVEWAGYRVGGVTGGHRSDAWAASRPPYGSVVVARGATCYYRKLT
jgi:hypothetical protein